MRLFREVGLLPAAALVIGNIIGIGIYTTSGLIARELGPSPWLMGVWVFGGALALVGALCYARLGSLMPTSGGEYAFLLPFYGPLVAFLSGWASLLIGFSAPIAASALALVHYLDPILPVELSASPWGVKGTACSALLLISIVLSLGLRLGARLHVFVTALNLLLILIFSMAVLFTAPDPGATLWSNLFQEASLPPLTQFSSAVILVMFSYSGWNAAVYIGEEIRQPQKNIPRALILGTLSVIGLYLLINLAYFGGVAWAALDGQIAVADIVATQVLGAGRRQVVNLLIVISILSSLTAMTIAGPRVYFAMSRDRLFPRWVSEVSTERKVPVKALWFQFAVALLLILLGTFYQILIYSGFVLLLFSTLAVSVLFRSSRKNGRVYSLLAAVFVLVNLVILFHVARSHPNESLAGLLTVAAGLPVYRYFRRSGVTD